jgi:5-bromo-4-chloroindolyl phosphate hydrolysis protein
VKQKLKYILPILVIVVLLWGLLEFAEKAALLISITVLTSYIMIQFREDKKLRRQAMLNVTPYAEETEVLQLAPPEVPLEIQLKERLTDLLRVSLRLSQGRFKQEVEDVNRRADQVVAALEAGRESPQNFPLLYGQMDEMIGLIEKYLILQERVKTQPDLQEQVHDIQSSIRRAGEAIHRYRM